MTTHREYIFFFDDFTLQKEVMKTLPVGVSLPSCLQHLYLWCLEVKRNNINEVCTSAFTHKHTPVCWFVYKPVLICDVMSEGAPSLSHCHCSR